MKEAENEVVVTVLEVEAPWVNAYEAFLQKGIHAVGAQRFDLSVTLCNDAFIRELNRDYRDKDEATDVLSFDAEAPDDPFETEKTPKVPGVFGALVISLDTLRTNSAYFQVEFQEELKRVSLHGMLHLMGWDHETNEPTEPMLVHQEKILSLLKDRLF